MSHSRPIAAPRLQDIAAPHTLRSLYREQMLELAEVRSPGLAGHELEAAATRLSADVPPIYVHVPWRREVLEMLPETAFFELKTNRNQLLLTREEQQQLYDTPVSIAGLSVGSAQLFGLVGSGMARRIALADGDTISTTNLNRTQATVFDIGRSKTEVAAERAFEMNPFLDIAQFGRLTPGDVDAFLLDGRSRVIFEEIDDFVMKVVLRERAKVAGIPLVMLTNLGDNVMIDVERYDFKAQPLPFNGLVDGELIARIKSEPITPTFMRELSIRLVDGALLSERAKNSVRAIGTSLVGRPQLYGTVALDGGLAPYLLRRIVLDGKPLASGRYCLRLDGVMGGAHG